MNLPVTGKKIRQAFCSSMSFIWTAIHKALIAAIHKVLSRFKVDLLPSNSIIQKKSPHRCTQLLEFWLTPDVVKLTLGIAIILGHKRSKKQSSLHNIPDPLWTAASCVLELTSLKTNSLESPGKSMRVLYPMRNILLHQSECWSSKRAPHRKYQMQ